MEAKTLSSARLIDTRYQSITANLGPGAKLKPGGDIQVEVLSRIQAEKNHPRRAVAKVEVNITAIPREAKSDDEYAFKLSVVCLGLYDWPSEATRPDIGDDNDLIQLLCQPVYVVAATETMRIARGFNMGSAVKLPLDVRLLADNQQANETPSGKPSRATPGKAKAKSKSPSQKATATAS